MLQLVVLLMAFLSFFFLSGQSHYARHKEGRLHRLVHDAVFFRDGLVHLVGHSHVYVAIGRRFQVGRGGDRRPFSLLSFGRLGMACFQDYRHSHPRQGKCGLRLQHMVVWD